MSFFSTLSQYLSVFTMCVPKEKKFYLPNSFSQNQLNNFGEYLKVQGLRVWNVEWEKNQKRKTQTKKEKKKPLLM